MKIISRLIINLTLIIIIYIIYVGLLSNIYQIPSTILLLFICILIIIVIIDTIFRLGKYQKVVTAYDKSLKIDPKDTVALNNKGASLSVYKAYYEKSLECFNKVLEIDPNDAAALHNKGVILDKMGKHREALEYYDKALESHTTFETVKKEGKIILEV